jgi:hypothetical protein
MIRTPCILTALFLLVALCPVARALEPLPPAEQAAFYKGVHGYIGCGSCHEPDRPDRIPRQEVPKTCGTPCHPTQLSDYTTSVHWEGESPGAVCIDCHGIHGITPVKRPDSRAHRSLVCGTCHLGSKENFDRGPHKEGLEKSGALACASCHSNHRVQRPTIDLVEPACLQCHPQDSPAFGVGQSVKTRFTTVRDTLALAATNTARAGALGVNVQRPRETLREAWAGFARARLVWHSLQMDEIEGATDQTLSTAPKALVQVSDLLASHRLRRLGLVIAWSVILANIALLYLKKRKVDRM